MQLLRKIGFMLLTIWVALTINFALPRLMPGNPAQTIMAKFRGKLPPRALHSLEVAFGINVKQNIFDQYWSYLNNTIHGDLGLSITYFPEPVSKLLEKAIPWTLSLMGISTIIAFVLGTLLGIKSAWKRNHFLYDMSVPVGLFLQAIPYFWLALLFLYVFAYTLGWFPLAGGTSGYYVGFFNVLDMIYHSILPAFTIIITASGGWLLTMRNNMINVLSEDYVSFAVAKGIPDKKIMYQYAARNAMLPSITGFAMAIGYAVGGALVTEMVFSYPGVGYLLFQAVESLDYPLMQAIFSVITIAVILANFLADVALVFLDPRIKSGGREG